MSERSDLLESIANTIKDYREGQIEKPTPEHVDTWVKQFGEDVQIPLLREIDHVLKGTYLTRDSVVDFLRNLARSRRLAGDQHCAFWKAIKFLNIQRGGDSQREMLAMFDAILQEECGFKTSACGNEPQAFLYLDDVLFSGNRIKNDLSPWIKEEAPKEAKIHVVTIALHRGGQFYAKESLEQVAAASGKKVEFDWWRIRELEDRRFQINSSDVLRPTVLPTDAHVKEYAASLRFPVVLRTPPSRGEHEFFSSEEGRQVLEQTFLKAGVDIRDQCPYLNRYQRPLGNMVLETLGFGSMIVTFRNCPNNAPLALWVGDPWHPLFSAKDQLMHRTPEVRTYKREDSVVFNKTKEAFGGLSNMAAGFPLNLNGVRIRTSEALYQACRFPHLADVQRLIIEEVSPMTAKMKSKPYREDSRPDWERVRVKIMRWCLRVKLAQNWSSFSSLLLSTGDRPIVEQSRKDDFWGAKAVDADTLVGMNVLGRLLMELREEVKKGERDQIQRVEPLQMADFLLFGRPIQAAEAPPVKSGAASPPAANGPEAAPIQEPGLLVGVEVKHSSLFEGITTLADEGTLINALKPYSGYEDSGQAWLGAIPAHWSVRKLKHLTRFVNGIPFKPGDWGSSGVPIIRIQNLNGSKEFNYTRRPNLPEALRIRPGELLFAWSGNRGTSFGPFVWNRNFDGYLNQHIFKLTGYSLGTQYFAYVLRAVTTHIEQEKAHGIIGLVHITKPELGSVSVPIARPDEQLAIVRFLDYANRRIDSFIKAKKKVIALLNEQKQAIIHRIITRGLDPSVPLKPSGVPWLGEIPTHWEVLRAKYVFREVDERSTTGNEELLSVSHITGVTPRSEKNVTMFKASSYVGHKLCRLGDLVINTMWAWMAALGVSTRAGIVSPAYAVYRPRNPQKLVGAYLDDLLRTMPYAANYISRSTGIRSSRLRLYPEEFFKIGIVLPPVTEQQEIVNKVKENTADLDSAILRTEREIGFVREYRTRLTSDIVTGKLDVREAAKHVPDEPEDLAASVTEEEPNDETEIAEEEQIA